MQEFQYLKPSSLEEALELIDKYGNEAMVFAGGTDVIVGLRGRVLHCNYLIDIKGIKELYGISYDDTTGLTIGSAVTLNEIIDSEDINSNYKILKDSAKTLANALIRNRATLAGNICNSSPGGDMLPASLVLEGRVVAASIKGTREIALKDFFKGAKKNALNRNEIVLKVIYPPASGMGRFIKKSRIKGHDLSQISVAGYLSNKGSLRFSLGAVAPVPVLVDNFPNYNKSSLNRDRELIADNVVKNINPIDDVRGTKEYRLSMARYLTCKILEELEEKI